MATTPSKVLLASKPADMNAFDALILPLRIERPSSGSKLRWEDLLVDLDVELAQTIQQKAKKADWTIKPDKIYSFDFKLDLRLVIWLVGADVSRFKLLEQARLNVAKLQDQGIESVLVDLRRWSAIAGLVDVLVSALAVKQFESPKQKKKKKSAKSRSDQHFVFWVKDDLKSEVNRVSKLAFDQAEGTNLVRSLVMRPGNDLHPKAYHKYVRDLAHDWGIEFEWMGISKLKSLNAGAFLAVSQGSGHQDGGIAHLVYQPKKSVVPHLVLVGKGVTFDTGGTNLKPAGSMFGMHGDMGGSAVALAVLQTAILQNWPYKVSCYLAISDNAIGPSAYRPNDVVESSSGKTIEIVHTDAEGRMLLADTLYIASKQGADLLMDFATLTGACVGAIGTSYSGVFTNRPELNQLLIEAGQKSGERVWPFPLDDDFGDCLKSDIADIKQCRLKGGVDHIEAAYFLKEFVKGKVPWVHVDLAALENSGGLAHVDTDVSGFGVRFASQFITSYFKASIEGN